MMKWFLVMLAIPGMIGCKSGNASGRILEQEKMQAVMWDVIGADVFTDQFIKKDSSKNATLENIRLQNKIFAIHHISRADYYKSYEYYLSHTDLMKTVLDSMTAKGERDRMKITEQNYDRHNLIKKDSIVSNNGVYRHAR